MIDALLVTGGTKNLYCQQGKPVSESQEDEAFFWMKIKNVHNIDIL